MNPPTDASAPDGIAGLRHRLAGSLDAAGGPSAMRLPAGLDQLLSPSILAGLRPAAVLVPILQRESGDTILLTQRAETLRHHTGEISFPGGRRDEGDASLVETALREAQEEVGLPPESVEVLGYLGRLPTLTGYHITPVVGLIATPFVAVPDPREVAEIFELPLAEVLAEGRFVHKTLMRGTLRLPFRELQYGRFRIWGATAAILWHLRCTLLGQPDGFE